MDAARSLRANGYHGFGLFCSDIKRENVVLLACNSFLLHCMLVNSMAEDLIELTNVVVILEEEILPDETPNTRKQ